jgi:hypothetical protein
MSLSNRILVLDDSFDLATLTARPYKDYRSVICLFWLAPSTKIAISRSIGASSFCLGDIIKSDMAWGKSAYDLATQVVEGGPSYGDLYWRTYLTEPLYLNAHILILLEMIVDFIEELRERWAVSTIFIDGLLDKATADLLATILSDHSRLIYHSLTCQGENRVSAKGKGLLAGLRNRFREACLTRDWRRQAMDLTEWLDKTYCLRTYLGGLLCNPDVSEGGVAVFSSYFNNSRTLSAFVDLMPWPVHWVLANDSARQGLANGMHKYYWIWEFARTSCPKTRDEELQFDDRGISESLSFLKTWLTRNPIWQKWKSIELSLLVTLTHCWEIYLERAKPSLIIMAGQWGIEGWFAQIAKKRHIPVVQVMHGALGGYLHTQTPIISDLMVVPGDFWRELWPEEQRRKIVVHNPAGNIKKVRKKSEPKKRCVTFFSWPLMTGTFYNFSEFTDGFIHIFHKILLKEKYKVIVRAHPLENPQNFVERWRHLKGALPSTLCISKREPLDGVLSETDVALMFRSTVMLDCLANDIPVVMPGWIDFGWNQALTGVPNIYLARDFVDLEQRLLVWLGDPPEVSEEVAKYFVRPSGEDRSSFLSLMNELASGGQIAC